MIDQTEGVIHVRHVCAIFEALDAIEEELAEVVTPENANYWSRHLSLRKQWINVSSTGLNLKRGLMKLKTVLNWLCRIPCRRVSRIDGGAAALSYKAPPPRPKSIRVDAGRGT